MCKQATPLFGRSVLVAEDEPLIALDIADMLELTGCVVIGPFDRLSHAVAAVANNHIDMAVLDVDLEGEAVWPVAKLLQKRQVPFVFLTGYPRLAEFTHAIWLHKPFRSATLLGKLAQLSDGEAAPWSPSQSHHYIAGPPVLGVRNRGT